MSKLGSGAKRMSCRVKMLYRITLEPKHVKNGSKWSISYSFINIVHIYIYLNYIYNLCSHYVAWSNVWNRRRCEYSANKFFRLQLFSHSTITRPRARTLSGSHLENHLLYRKYNVCVFVQVWTTNIAALMWFLLSAVLDSYYYVFKVEWFQPSDPFKVKGLLMGNSTYI